MRRSILLSGRLGLFAIAFIALPIVGARADSMHPSADIPIQQSVNRNGAIRYSIWVKVGERTFQALVDTGSTGLRVLPMVVPGELEGSRSIVTFGAGISLMGTEMRAPVAIGSRAGEAIVQVIDALACTDQQPNCPVATSLGDNFRIGDDGVAHQGYPAIIGIGLPFRGTDIDNPLQALGIKRWIVELPRPLEEAEGHLILDPSDDQVAGFTRLARHGSADADGCIKGGPLTEEQCGNLLFDTGAPAMTVSFDGVRTASSWDQGAAGRFSFTTNDAKTLTLDFHVGEDGGMISAVTTPPNRHDAPGAFILAGIDPFFAYDILYDATAHSVALRAREARPVFPVGDVRIASGPPRSPRSHGDHDIRAETPAEQRDLR